MVCCLQVGGSPADRGHGLLHQALCLLVSDGTPLAVVTAQVQQDYMDLLGEVSSVLLASEAFQRQGKLATVVSALQTAAEAERQPYIPQRCSNYQPVGTRAVLVVSKYT